VVLIGEAAAPPRFRGDPVIVFVSLSTHLFVFHGLDQDITSLFYRFGFRRAEIWAMPPHFSYRDPAETDRVLGLLDRAGVAVASLHAPLYPDVRGYRKDRWYSLSSTDEEHRRSSVEAAAAAGSCLALRGGGTLVLHTGFPAQDWYPRRFGTFLGSVNDLLERLPGTVRLAVENTYQPSGAVGVILDIVRRYPPERVGVCLDMGHAHILEGVPEAVEASEGRIIHVHAHDNHGARDDHFVPGRGSIDWDRALSALAGAGFEGPLTLELSDHAKGAGPPYDSFEEILEEASAFADRVPGGRS
jgi:sugar phosphate isomerase/epimerase